MVRGINLHRTHQRHRALVQPIPGKDARFADQRRLDTIQGDTARDIAISRRGWLQLGRLDRHGDVIAPLLPYHTALPEQFAGDGDSLLDPGSLVGDKVETTARAEHPSRAPNKLLLDRATTREVALHQVE